MDRPSDFSSRRILIGAFGALLALIAVVGAYWALVANADAPVSDRPPSAVPSPVGHTSADAASIDPEASVDNGATGGVQPNAPKDWNIGNVSAKDYDALKARAEAGDAVASTQVYLVLKNCEDILASTWSTEEVVGMQRSGIDVDRVMADREAELGHCARFSRADLLERTKWLTQAADAGYVMARLIYSIHLEQILGGPRGMMKDPAAVERGRNRVVGYLRDSAAQGDPDAVGALATTYENGVLLGRDPVVAQGLRIASARLDPSSESRRQLADIWAQRLSPAQQREAEAYARDFLERQKRS
jgi:TPR repeat protein